MLSPHTISSFADIGYVGAEDQASGISNWIISVVRVVTGLGSDDICASLKEWRQIEGIRMLSVHTPAHALAIHLQGIEIVCGNHDRAADIGGIIGYRELLGKRHSVGTLRVSIPQADRPDPMDTWDGGTWDGWINLGPCATGAEVALVSSPLHHAGSGYLIEPL